MTLAADHPPIPVPDTAEKFWHLVDIYWPIGVGVFALVTLALLGVGWRFRSTSDEYPEGKHEWPLVEYSWAALVAAVAGFLLYITFSTMANERETVATAYHGHPGTPKGALVVRVRAAQWGWRFDYPGKVAVAGDNHDWPTLVVPAQRPVHFEITSDDVIHSFWVAERKIKVDAFPRRTTTLNLIWPNAGTWHEGGRCNQYCGLYHTTMNFNVRALPGAQFDRWLAQRKAAA